MLRLGDSPGRGRGVFSTRPIQKGETIEIAPVIVVPVSDIGFLKKTILFNYYFNWSASEGTGALCLGYGSLYNHSLQPNAEYVRDFQNHCIIFRAIRTIQENQEIFTNYHGKCVNRDPFSFERRSGSASAS
jgi:uncharacterized protein